MNELFNECKGEFEKREIKSYVYYEWIMKKNNIVCKDKVNNFVEKNILFLILSFSLGFFMFIVFLWIV